MQAKSVKPRESSLNKDVQSKQNFNVQKGKRQSLIHKYELNSFAKHQQATLPKVLVSGIYYQRDIQKKGSFEQSISSNPSKKRLSVKIQQKGIQKQVLKAS